MARNRRPGPAATHRNDGSRGGHRGGKTFWTSAAGWAARRFTWRGPSAAASRGSRSAPCSVSGPAVRRDGTASPARRSSVVRMPSRSSFRRDRSTWCGASSAPSICTTRPGSSAAADGCGRADEWRSAPGWPARRSEPAADTTGVRRLRRLLLPLAGHVAATIGNG